MLASSLRMDIMLHAYLFMQSGIPVIYSGDEIGQLNDHTYRDDPAKADDSRYIHRGRMDWEKAERRKQPDAYEHQLFAMLNRLEDIRRGEKAFVAGADVWTLDTWQREVLGICRCIDDEKIIGLFNFSEHDRTAWIDETDGQYRDLLSGEVMEAKGVDIPAYGFYWLKRI